MDDMFVPGFGNRPALLVGRSAEVDDFETALKLAPGFPGRSILYVGQRGMGKTALLLELSTRASANGFVVARVTASEQMLDEIIQLLQLNGAKFMPSDKHLTGFSAGALGFNLGLTLSDGQPNHIGFRVQLSLLCDELARHGRGVVILVDEVTASSPQMRELATVYQSLVGEDKNIIIAMAGLPVAVSAVLNDKVLTFLNRARQVHLGPVSLSETTNFYAQAFREAGKVVSADVLDRAVQATCGYPYLLQLIGYHMLHLAGDGRQITAEMVTLAIANSKRDMVQSVYQPALWPLSKQDMAFLKAMAVDDGVSQIADIRQRMGVTPATVQQYRARLIASEAILPVRRGEVDFAVPYLRDYLVTGEVTIGQL